MLFVRIPRFEPVQLTARSTLKRVSVTEGSMRKSLVENAHARKKVPPCPGDAPLGTSRESKSVPAARRRRRHFRAESFTRLSYSGLAASWYP